MRDSFENEIPHIQFKDVSFSYPGRNKNLIVGNSEQFNLKILHKLGEYS